MTKLQWMVTMNKFSSSDELRLNEKYKRTLGQKVLYVLSFIHRFQRRYGEF